MTVTAISTRVRNLTAAAIRFTTRQLAPTRRVPDSGWQAEAWDYYSSTPEVRFAAHWAANLMSSATLFAGRRGPDGSVETAPEGHRAAELVASIAGGPTGQSNLLAAMGPHLTVAGEGWIVIRPSPEDAAAQDWQVLSVLEVQRHGTRLVTEIDGEQVEVPAAGPEHISARPDEPLAIRVWNPSPRRRLEADSAVRSSLVLLEELRLLNGAVAAITRSRLTGRGVLLVPQGTKFASSGEPGQQGEDDLIEVFMEVASTAYRDPESAAATVPIVLEVPADTIAAIKRVTFESEFDRIAIDLREETIRRFACGLEIPPEILLGTGSANHWTSWSVQEEAIRLGVEPKLALVADALTTQWLRPVLQEEGVADAAEWLVWFDTSQIRVRQNRSQTALQLYDREAISAAALRRETGFDESDAPDADELSARRAARAYRPPEGPDVRLPVGESTGIPDTEPVSAPGDDEAA